MSYNAHVDGRQNGAALKSLSPAQIRTLVLLAREAFAAEFPPTDESFDSWRHRQCLLTVERAGLTECRNEDFLPLKAHFLSLLGREEEAESVRLKHQTEPRTWALHELQRACNAAADVMPRAIDYVAGFLRNKRGCTIDEADAKALWHAVYVLRRKVEMVRRQESGVRT